MVRVHPPKAAGGARASRTASACSSSHGSTTRGRRPHPGTPPRRGRADGRAGQRRQPSLCGRLHSRWDGFRMPGRSARHPAPTSHRRRHHPIKFSSSCERRRGVAAMKRPRCPSGRRRRFRNSGVTAAFDPTSPIPPSWGRERCKGGRLLGIGRSRRPSSRHVRHSIRRCPQTQGKRPSRPGHGPCRLS